MGEGAFLIPGDKLLNGQVLKSENSNDRQDNVYYTSCTIRYAGLRLYATPKGFNYQAFKTNSTMRVRI